MPQAQSRRLEALADYLAVRRKAIMLAWRRAIGDDPEQTTAHSLNLGQLKDHIPQVLDSFEGDLRSSQGVLQSQASDADEKRQAVKHGLHRWQQGYRLQELVSEWGHLQLCLFEELETFVATYPEDERKIWAEAGRRIIAFVNEGISSSAVQYARMQQAEAAVRLNDLTAALASLNEIEVRRSALIHQAVHDLHGNVLGVTVAAKLLGRESMEETQRLEFANLLQKGVVSVTAMLGDLLDLARLEAGLEWRELAEFDAAALATELGKINEPLARERGLFLRLEGVPSFIVEGDCGKVRRLLQNLVLNSVKYTEKGGVTVSWGEEKENWWLMVKDTGPGLLAGPAAPMVAGLKAATAIARESDEQTAAAQGNVSHVLTPKSGSSTPTSLREFQPGEGVGLSIVKRLCELLDASLEVASSTETGTTFRVLFPRHYTPIQAS